MTDESLPPTNQPPRDAVGSTGADSETTRLIRSEELFAGRKVVLIEHAGERYRLLVTRNDRLILQK